MLTPKTEASMALRKFKGASAREANKRIGLTGQPFWAKRELRESRPQGREFARIDKYIPQDPVRAGLARSEWSTPAPAVPWRAEARWRLKTRLKTCPTKFQP